MKRNICWGNTSRVIILIAVFALVMSLAIFWGCQTEKTPLSSIDPSTNPNPPSAPGNHNKPGNGEINIDLSDWTCARIAWAHNKGCKNYAHAYNSPGGFVSNIPTMIQEISTGAASL